MLSARQRSDLPSREPAAVVNIGKLVSMTIEGIPKSMNLVFRPTDEMNLSEVELVVAIYIFMRHFPERTASHSGSAYDSGTEDGGCRQHEYQLFNSFFESHDIRVVSNTVNNPLDRCICLGVTAGAEHRGPHAHTSIDWTCLVPAVNNHGKKS
ncbi:uncharacterized protein DS421_16g541910 [Arachis hypogaea]|nr:uncharacterized protein DS421_16g541910 [Arachis hypogaea]